MTRTSIEACIKLFIVALVAVFVYVLWHVLQMMGVV
jgi:hypothetical protein